jgi:dihydrofolate reductase
MRKVIYGAACSLDGFITGPDGSIDWIHHSKDVSDLMSEYWKAMDTLVMGRKTWDFASSVPAPSNAEAESAWGGIKSYVFSRTLKTIDRPGVELVSSDAGEFVRNLKRQRGKNIIVFGGGDFARSLFEADVIDEVGLNVHPVLLGSGAPFFLDAKRRIKLELTECRPLQGGCVLLDYRVKHARTPKH